MDEHLSKILGMTPKSDALDSWGLIRPLLVLLLEEAFPTVCSCSEPGMQSDLARDGSIRGIHQSQLTVDNPF